MPPAGSDSGASHVEVSSELGGASSVSLAKSAEAAPEESEH